MKRNVFLLAFCQALLFICTSLVATSSALVGQQLADAPGLATVPVGLQFIAMVMTTFPASFLMKRIGRRGGFMIGAGIGMAGGALCTYAIFQHHFVLFCAGSFIFGMFSSFGQYFRFAAADVATPDYRSRAIAYVLAGGVVAAFIGPNLASWTRLGFSEPFAASFFALVGVCLILLLVVSALIIPPPGEQERSGVARPLGQIASQPVFIVAVLGAMIGYGVMNLVMTATPLAMNAYHHAFGDTAFVIQWHIVAMFGPSFFTGHLIRRFGVLNIMLCGALLQAICVGVNLSGTSVTHFWLGLTLLGMGWNFLYIGATTLITETYTIAEKAKTQALNDFSVFATVTLTAFSSGAIQQHFGWDIINISVTPLIILVLIAIIFLQLKQRKTAADRTSAA